MSAWKGGGRKGQHHSQFNMIYHPFPYCHGHQLEVFRHSLWTTPHDEHPKIDSLIIISLMQRTILD
jgi:hypothetical protein